MTAYVLAQLRFVDEKRYRRYQTHFPAVFAASEGKLLAADEAPQVVEGNWDLDKVVLMQFPTLKSAHSFLQSAEYQAIAKDRKAGASNVGLIFSGLPGKHREAI